MISDAHQQSPIEPLSIVEHVAGLALAMAIWDLSLRCRIEPDLFSVHPGEKPKVASFDTDDYLDAIQHARNFVPRRFDEGASICCLAYQGVETSEEGAQQRVIVIQVFWHNGDIALVTVPWGNHEGAIGWLGPFDVGTSKGSPNLSALEEAVLAGLPLFPKGYKVWNELKNRTKLQ
ncbi:hypothetical protein [Microvirga sp. G4-2]|uniref:hypothetical protein n=1 Tax=Microvirga sp. G4-2 TaxID=3434467 RepID=UPI004044B20F